MALSSARHGKQNGSKFEKKLSAWADSQGGSRNRFRGRDMGQVNLQLILMP